MITIAAVFFALLAIGVALARQQLADFEANILGGRVAPGCVTAQAVILFVFAVLVYLGRRVFE